MQFDGGMSGWSPQQAADSFLTAPNNSTQEGCRLPAKQPQHLHCFLKEPGALLLLALLLRPP